MFTCLPSNTLSIAYSIQSTTASTQHFFYQPLVSKADSTVIQPYISTIYGFPVSICMHLCIFITMSCWVSLHILFWWLYQLSLTSERIYINCTDVLYQIWISFSVCKVSLPRTLTTTDTMPFTALASHAYTLGPPQGLICLPLGCTPCILVNTNNDRDTHDAWGYVLPHILHHHLLISDSVRGISHGIFLAMPC